MKKQILFILLVLLTSTTISWGQTGNLTAADVASVACVPATAVSCLTGDALHPIPGQSYKYEIDIPSPTGWTGTYRWFVTQQPAATAAFIAGGTLTSDRDNALMAAYGNSAALDNTGYDDLTTGTELINIVWETFTHDPANPVFVVIHVRGTDPAGCPNDNIKIYMIEPQNAFTLDIANLGVDGSLQGAAYASCFSDVLDAKFNGTDGILYDYGTNYLFFTVNAANFNDSWRPSVRVTGQDAIQSISVDWAYPAGAIAGTWNAMAEGSTANVYETAGQVDAQSASKAVGKDGECIIIRVTVAHNNFEGDADLPITVAVDGKTRLDLALANQIPDIHHAAGATCGLPDDFTNDVVIHTLEQRPEMDSTPLPNYLPNTGDANP